VSQPTALADANTPSHEFRILTFNQTLHSIAHGLRWSRWRRRHQARARWYHHRARLRGLETLP
jgi:hypothetical protein